MLNTVFSTVLDMTITGSIVILVVLMARFGLKRMPKILSYCLWAAVLFRLLCPVSISLQVSAVPEVPSVKENYTLSDTRVDITDVGQVAYDAFQGAVIGLNRPITVPVVDHTSTGAVTKEIAIDYWELAVLLGQYVWLLGIVVMAVVSFVSYIKLKRQLAEAVRLNGNIHQVDSIPSPFVMGLLRPKIYLPSGLTEQEKEYVLLHEQHHIRRGDHIIKAVSYAALCLHWFNPLVWIAFTLSGRDMEMSCDEAVLKKLGGNVRADYASSLLRFSVGRTTISGAPLAFGEGDAGKRIQNLKRWKKPVLWVSIVAAVLCLAVLLCCVVNQKNSSDQNPTTPPSTTEPPATTQPPETTVPPTTQEPTLPNFPTGENVKYVTSERIDEDTYIFTTDEFPGVTFTSSWYGRLSMEENGNVVNLLTSCPIYGICLTDLNNDGLRELVVRYLLGSGIVSSEIYVFNYADMTSYKLEERRNSWNYSLKIEDDKMIVVRSHEWSDSAVQTEGRLLLVDRQLIFDDGVNVIYGTRIDPLIDKNRLDEINTLTYTHYPMCDTLAYFITKHEAAMDYPFSYYGGADDKGFVDIAGYSVTEETKELFRCFHNVAHITQNYVGYFYYDAENPGRLFVCSEFRDLGYKYIRDYYEDLMAGRCSAHEETFLISLDELAIYRWGSDENLYNDIVS